MKSNEDRVLRFADCDEAALSSLLTRFGLGLKRSPDGDPIPGSFWGDEEAGLLGDSLVVRADTPVHSVLHEACHYICMDSDRRRGLHTDAGGNYDEENAVCYLQILLADELPGFGRERMMADMDAWGYSFRLGSACRWFREDAQDARDWLVREGLLAPGGRPTFRLRGRPGGKTGQNGSRP
ncbi:MAG: hypothetical protein HKP03_08430 [Xanthomonadales bacterium]|nr:hypothetical protein [Xanthomonadales bacterium]